MVQNYPLLVTTNTNSLRFIPRYIKSLPNRERNTSFYLKGCRCFNLTSFISAILAVKNFNSRLSITRQLLTLGANNVKKSGYLLRKGFWHTNHNPLQTLYRRNIPLPVHNRHRNRERGVIIFRSAFLSFKRDHKLFVVIIPILLVFRIKSGRG